MLQVKYNLCSADSIWGMMLNTKKRKKTHPTVGKNVYSNVFTMEF